MQITRSLIGRALLLALPLCFAAGSAQAAGNDELTQQCAKYQTSYDQTYCVAKLFLASDKELNDVYKKLKGHVKGDTQKGLTQVQRDWIKYRNGACEGGTGSIDVDCNYRVNRARTNYLRDRVRECETGSCNNGLIDKRSWQ